MANSLSSFFSNLKRAWNRTKLRWQDYDLWKEIESNPLKKGNTHRNGRQWLKKCEKTFHRGKFLTQGKLYIFDYDTPKYQDILPWFDTQPLVISLGPIETSLGRRNLAINMHLIPPRIRRIVMFKIFEIYRQMYKDQFFAKSQEPVFVKWKEIAQPLEKYGIAFALRMYIPELMKNTIEFKYEQWKDAIYVESKGLSKISFDALQTEWRKFVTKQKQTNSPAKNLRENWGRS